MEAIPVRFRQRIMELYEKGKKTKEIAEMLGTSRSGTRRIKQRQRERGTLEPRKPKTGYASGLTEQVRQQLCDAVAADPDATREELRDQLHLTVNVRTVSKWLKKLGLGLKKSRSMPPSRIGPT